MKILICSAPKSGNTWLNNILMSIYKLEPLALSRATNFDEIFQAGDDWISYLHAIPSEEVLKKLKSMGVILVTIVRHPGDQLVSMINFSKWYFESVDPERSLIGDAEVDDPTLLNYASTLHLKNLRITMLWDSCGSHIIKYEDLFYKPFEALKNLTTKIRQVNDLDIHRGIALASPEISKGLRWVKKQFIVNDGSPMKWVNLHSLVIEYAKNATGFRQFCKRYGYSFEKEDVPSLSKDDSFNGFPGLPNHFDNGVKFHPVFKAIYINNCPEFFIRFPDPAQTGPESFFQWLNDANEDALITSSFRAMTNLMSELYKLRIDLRQSFPKIVDEDASNYYIWFFDFGHYQVNLPEIFMTNTWELYSDYMRNCMIEVGK